METYYHKPKANKSGNSRIIVIIVFIALFLLAAIKNPSESEVRNEVRSMIQETVNGNMTEVMTNDNNSAITRLGSAISMFLAPTIIDNWIKIDVSNYIFFSTFDAKVSIGEESKTIVSGVVLFGKIIPLGTDIKEEYLNQQ